MELKLLRVCRGILRELMLTTPAREGGGDQWRYIASAVRLGKAGGSLTSCHGEKTLTSYLTYLQSSRRHRELLDFYQGKGERSLEDSARLVGLTLPKHGMETTSPGTETDSHAPHGTETVHTAT